MLLGSRIDDVRVDDDMDTGPPDLENHNGNQQEAVFSDEETDSPPQKLKGIRISCIFEVH